MGQIHKAAIAVMREIRAIAKTKQNKDQGYVFRGIDDMYNAIHPLFQKHGIFITAKILNTQREDRKTARGNQMIYSIIDFEFSFCAEDGSCMTTQARGEGADTSDKSSNKAASMALKYALMQMFLIPTAETSKLDTDAGTPSGSAPAKVTEHKEEQGLPEEIVHSIACMNEVEELMEWAGGEGMKEYHNNNLFRAAVKKRQREIEAKKKNAPAVQKSPDAIQRLSGKVKKGATT